MYKTREEIESWLIEMKVENYVIHEDLTVDVNGDVDISSFELNEILIKFGKVNGNFDCCNNQLTSLEGCPEVINGDFYCNNNQLTNLEWCPKEVNGDFYCEYNELTSLEYFPKEINGEFIYIHENDIIAEELVNFNCNIVNVIYIYSDFNESGDKKEFLEKVKFYQNIKKENELLKELSINSNNIKLNKKL